MADKTGSKGMPKGKSRRMTKYRAVRAARRASGVVEKHKRLNLERAKKQAGKWMKTPRGTARRLRRLHLQWAETK
jgi:hypothetical protein